MTRNAVHPSSNRWLSLGRQALQGVVHLIYPPSCHLCGQSLPPDGSDFCDACIRSLTDDPVTVCPRCALTVGAFSNLDGGCSRCRDEFHFAACMRLGQYQGPLRDAVLQMKHSAGENMAHALGKLWAQCRHEKLSHPKADCVIPVPLFWLRRMQRGYNQAETLALVLSVKLGIPCRPGWLKRIRHTPHQTGQSLTARRENVHGAFWASPHADFKGKTVLLVDDVMTTGSTCSEAASTLKKAGVERVIAAILARSESEYIRQALTNRQKYAS